MDLPLPCMFMRGLDLTATNSWSICKEEILVGKENQKIHQKLVISVLSLILDLPKNSMKPLTWMIVDICHPCNKLIPSFGIGQKSSSSTVMELFTWAIAQILSLTKIPNFISAAQLMFINSLNTWKTNSIFSTKMKSCLLEPLPEQWEQFFG